MTRSGGVAAPPDIEAQPHFHHTEENEMDDMNLLIIDLIAAAGPLLTHTLNARTPEMREKLARTAVPSEGGCQIVIRFGREAAQVLVQLIDPYSGAAVTISEGSLPASCEPFFGSH